MVAVVDLDARAAIGRRERIRHRPELRRELLVRQAGDDRRPFDERQVGHRLRASAAAGRAHGRRIRQRDARELHVSSDDEVDLARAVDPQERRLGGGALAAHHRHERVLRRRMHGEIGDGDVRGGRAEHRGDLLIDAGDVLVPGVPPMACAPRSSAKMVAACRSAAKSTPSGPKASGPIDVKRRAGAVGRPPAGRRSERTPRRPRGRAWRQVSELLRI